MSQIISISSKCFNFLGPVLKENLIDSQDSFVLGSILGKDPDHFDFIMDTMERIIILKKTYDMDHDTLDTIYSLVLEQNLAEVFYLHNIGKSINANN